MGRTAAWAIFIPALLCLSSCNKGPNDQTVGTPSPDQGSVDSGEKPNPAPLIFCEEVGKRVTAEDCDYYGELAKRTKVGVGAFNAPDPMTRGKTVTLQLVIAFAPDPPVQGAEPAVDASANSAAPSIDDGGASSGAPMPAPPPMPTPAETVDQLPGETVTFAPTVGRFMKAELTGEGFEIERLSAEHQEVLLDSQTTWEWKVKAIKGASHILTLKTVVEAKDDQGNYVPLRSTTKNQTIKVEVKFWDRVLDWILGAPVWIKAITALASALIAFLALFKLPKWLRRQPENEKPQE